MLFDIDRGDWDEDLCRLLNIPMCILPEPVGNSELYGHVISGLPGLEGLAGAPVCGSAGDQQAALFGQGCFRPGMVKNTYGTGCFTLMNTGTSSLRSSNGLVTSVGWRLGEETTYILEGSVYNAGSAIQWLRDELGLISTAHEIDILAETVPDNGGVYMVPAFTGLGAPYWDMYARGTIVGITRGTRPEHIIRAAQESIAFQSADLVLAMEMDTGAKMTELKVDGGASRDRFLMQFQADILGKQVRRPMIRETTALGAAYLAGLATGVWKDRAEIVKLWHCDSTFTPRKDEGWRQQQFQGWNKAVGRSLHWAE
jgi:glycerol kinase